MLRISALPATGGVNKLSATVQMLKQMLAKNNRFPILCVDHQFVTADNVFGNCPPSELGRGFAPPVQASAVSVRRSPYPGRMACYWCRLDSLRTPLSKQRARERRRRHEE